MSDLSIEVGLGDLTALQHRLQAIGNQAPHIIRRAINWTGDRARTQVYRTLAKQTGAKYGTVKRSILTKRANYSGLVYRLIAFGHFLPLSEFEPEQTPKGVRASPWGKRKIFPHAFMADALGAAGSRHVFVREVQHGGKRVGRLPIRELFGPALPRELLKGQTVVAFTSTVNHHLVSRVEHELGAVLGGYVPRG